jgi:hypothetical protein
MDNLVKEEKVVASVVEEGIVDEVVMPAFPLAKPMVRTLS